MKILLTLAILMAATQSTAEMIKAGCTFTASYSFDGSEVRDYSENRLGGMSNSGQIQYDNETLLFDDGASTYVYKTLSRDAGPVISNHKFISNGFLGTQVVNLNNPDCNKELEDRNVFWASTFSSGTVHLIFLDCPCKY
tara:strand:+ start:451 stop:867 length:417 start_codon:yes stop_codon:yes gene_type:complete